MLAHMPAAVASLVSEPDWQGSDLIILSSSIARPSSQELANNFSWLKPIVLDSPHKVLGLERDGLLHLDLGKKSCILFESVNHCMHAVPLQVPSGYYLTDAFLRLDQKLNKMLFRPNPRESRLFLAGREGSRAKSCIGALRYLWRNTDGSHDPKVLDLKRALCPSPQRDGGLRALATCCLCQTEAFI